MTIRNDCLDFGRELLRTADLDPLYVMLYNTRMHRGTLGRFIVAYSLYYHAGVAAMCAEAYGPGKFWKAVEKGIETFPRGTERRHWRGKAARASFADISAIEPDSLIAHWEGECTFKSVFHNVQIRTGFGPWIAFKIADLMDRSGYRAITGWDSSHAAIYDDPKKGAALYLYGDQEHPISVNETSRVLAEIQGQLKDYKAPPIYDRPINVQEAETILCKFKSHVNGHYPVGKDTKEIIHALDGWGILARELALCPLF